MTDECRKLWQEIGESTVHFDREGSIGSKLCPIIGINAFLSELPPDVAAAAAQDSKIEGCSDDGDTTPLTGAATPPKDQRGTPYAQAAGSPRMRLQRATRFLLRV